MSDRQDGDKQILARIDGALKKYDTPGLPVLNPKLDVWECNGMVCYDGQCFPVTLGDTKIGFKCMSEACGSISKGTILSKHIGITIGKNAFICYIKDVGMVCAEALERNRRDPSKKHKNAQADETVSQ